jgi:putative two-component system response regulator
MATAAYRGFAVCAIILQPKLRSNDPMRMAEPTRHRSQRILVVDDHFENRLLMRDLLIRQGYEVLVADNAVSAEQIMNQSHPDLVLLDVIMPGKSGYEFCRELKDAPETRLIPVVMITGLSDLEDKIRGIEAGADDFLNKPIFPVELFARVASLLRVKEYTDELENADTVLCTLGRSVESRDPYTEGHCERLAEYASELGRFVGLGEEEQLALRRGGFLHDLGKIVISDTILKKQGLLTSDEWHMMRLHPVVGENICKPLRSMRLVLPIIRHHHEHWNGTGYPDGLTGEAIPLLARVLQVVDVYDALRTERPYKPAHTHQSARETMFSEARSGLWDEAIVREFFSMMALRENAA